MSPEGKSLHTSGAPIFMAATQGVPPDCLALGARRAYVPGPMGV